MKSPAPGVGDLNVLFVDDDLVTRTVYEKAVGPKLGSFRLATSGRDGLFAFARYAPDIVVADIKMPGMSGLEMAQAIRSMRSDTPIVMVTAFDEIDFLKQAIEIGVYRYVCKPINVAALIACLSECGELVRRRREFMAHSRLSETVLTSLPYPAMLLRRSDRRIMLANKAAVDLGFVEGAADEAGFGYAWGEQDLENLEFAATRQQTGPTQFFGHAAFGRIWNVTLAIAGPGIVFVSAADVTRNIELERALSQAEATYRTIFENAMEGIYQTTPTGRILKANQAMARIFGYDTPELMVDDIGGNIAAAFLDPTRREELLGILAREGRASGFEFEIVKKDGETAWVSVSVRAVRDDDGEIVRLDGLAQDVTEVKRRELELKKRATHDELTGLPNRNFFRSQGEHTLAQAKRTNTPLAMLYIDLDDFKDVNDSLGHHAGDMVLRQIALRLTKRLRQSDLLARIGGDEFFAILWNMNCRNKSRALAMEIIDDVRQPCEVDGNHVQVGASVGVSIYPDDGENFHELVKKADAAMYQAKRLGKNSCQVYSDS